MRIRLKPAQPILTAVAVAGIVWLSPARAVAQNYPDHLIKIVVPFAPAGRWTSWPGSWHSACRRSWDRA